MVRVRIATQADAAAILEIYSPYVLNTSFTFETDIPKLEEFRARMQHHLHKYPWIVCEINGEIAGYVYASAHRERAAYQWTCECSVYLKENVKRRGVGWELYKTLFEILKKQGLVNVYAGITLPNAASVRLHEKCGFVHFALYDNIGYKLGSWHKVGWWKLQLNEYQLKPTPPLKLADLEPNVIDEILQKASQAIETTNLY